MKIGALVRVTAVVLTLAAAAVAVESGGPGEKAAAVEPNAVVEAAPGLPAFPGAEGFGAVAKGGRGGRVIKVTNLDSSGPGSLQEALSAEGPRIVVFAVSGVIPGDAVVEHGEITIAGQTAPGGGITINGQLRSSDDPRHPVDDIIVRFVRVRPPKQTGASGDAVRFSNGSRVILDHVSCSWACDETVDIYSAKDVTLQWCTIEESDPTGHNKGVHNFGLISGPEGRRVSIHHTLFAHHRRRSPAIANGPADVRNNVVYNFRDGFLHDNEPNDGVFNIVANYYKGGVSDPQIFPFCFMGEARYWLRDNYIHGVGVVQDPWAEKDKLFGLQYYSQWGRPAEAPAPVPPVETQSAREAYRLVLAKAGAFPRDAVTLRTVREVEEGTGSWGRRDPEDLMEGLEPGAPPEDGDEDGMSDEWEKAHGLDPSDSADAWKVMGSGYTAVEEYVNALAERLLE